MKPGESFALMALKKVSSLMDYEMLVSRPGISEPDSNFIWASTFRAPIGVSFIRENVFFNLFLPEGSENEGDKKLFLNRVGAKFQDDLWQVRRSMDQVKGVYGATLKIAVSNFKSVVLDYSYIKRGRTYAHLVFNEADLSSISDGLLSSRGQENGLRVEYLKKTSGEITVFKVVEDEDQVSAVTIEASYDGVESQSAGNGNEEMFFIMGNVLEKGVKTVGKLGKNGIPELLMPEDVTEMEGSLVSFSSCNQLIVDLVELMASDYIVVYGFYGSVSNHTINLTINVPSQQTPSLLKNIGQLIKSSGSWKVKLSEIIFFKDLIE